LVGYLALCVIIDFTLLQRREQYNALGKETEKSAIPTVAVIHPTVEPSQEDLALPSTLQAYVESPIYARTTGYVKSGITTSAAMCKRAISSQKSKARKSISSFLRRVPTSAPCKPMKIFLASPPHVLKKLIKN